MRFNKDDDLYMGASGLDTIKAAAQKAASGLKAVTDTSASFQQAAQAIAAGQLKQQAPETFMDTLKKPIVWGSAVGVLALILLMRKK